MAAPLLVPVLAALGASVASGGGPAGALAALGFGPSGGSGPSGWKITVYDDQFYDVPNGPPIGYVDVDLGNRTVTAGTLDADPREPARRWDALDDASFDRKAGVVRLWVTSPLRGRSVYDHFVDSYTVQQLERARNAFLSDRHGLWPSRGPVEDLVTLFHGSTDDFLHCVGPESWIRDADVELGTVLRQGVEIFSSEEDRNLICGTRAQMESVIERWVRGYVTRYYGGGVSGRASVERYLAEEAEARFLLGLPWFGLQVRVHPPTLSGLDWLLEDLEWLQRDGLADQVEVAPAEDGVPGPASFVLWIGGGE